MGEPRACLSGNDGRRGETEGTGEKGQMKGSKGLEKVKGLTIQEEEGLGFLSSFFCCCLFLCLFIFRPCHTACGIPAP